LTKLSDTQRAVLSDATQRTDRLVLPLPERLKGGAAVKVIASLVAKGLVEEADAKPGEPVWRETGDGHGVTLVATDAAFAALRGGADEAPEGAAGGADASAPADTAPDPLPAPVAPARKTRADTKQAQVVGLLRRPEGATIDEIAGATGWQRHTVRGAIAGALKKKLRLDVTSEKIDERGRVYRIA
jgi:Protein of unknown function (DUF3489)